MQVVILAAGKGSRLGHGDLPKPLTQLITGQSILQRQLEILAPFFSPKNTFIVVGYHQNLIMDKFPGYNFVENPNYAHENTSKSLLKALKQCKDDVLWLNGDVVFHPSVIHYIITKAATSMIVNTAVVDAESVKYRKNSAGYILEASKQVVQPNGEALGINYVTKKDLPKFCENLAACAPTDYFEKGLELCIQQGLSVLSIPIAADLCTEVDFPEDLERANSLLKSWQ